jgi:hypothetical protein
MNKVLRFFKGDLDYKDNKIIYDSIKRELLFNNILSLNTEDIYNLYTAINNFLIDDDSDTNFFLYKPVNTNIIENFYVHISFL